MLLPSVCAGGFEHAERLTAERDTVRGAGLHALGGDAPQRRGVAAERAEPFGCVLLAAPASGVERMDRSGSLAEGGHAQQVQRAGGAFAAVAGGAVGAELGGSAAVSDKAFEEIEALTNQPKAGRIAGPDRYATAAATAAMINASTSRTSRPPKQAGCAGSTTSQPAPSDRAAQSRTSVRCPKRRNPGRLPKQCKTTRGHR